MVRLLVSSFLMLAAAGCMSPASKAELPVALPAAVPTTSWHRDVRPLVELHCRNCHTVGGIGTFTLDSLEQARQFAPAMASAVAARRMPPFPAAADCGGPFVDENRLSDAEIALFQTWAMEGGPEGDPAEAKQVMPPAKPVLASVDLTLRATSPYTPRGADDYHCFVIDPALTMAKFITGYEVVPGTRTQVHHVNLFSATRMEAVARDQREAGEGYTCFGSSGLPSQNLVGAWAPGTSVVNYPDNTGIQLTTDRVLVMQIHYNVSASTALPDQTTTRFSFASGQVQSAFVLPLVDNGFVVPPQVTNFTPNNHPVQLANTFSLFGRPLTANVWGVGAHMHTRGTRIRIEHEGACVLDIPKWDFNWQRQYFRKTPIVVRPGERMGISCTWTNETSQSLRWGENTEDEMCIAFLYITTS
jgi:hypothetical protein